MSHPPPQTVNAPEGTPITLVVSRSYAERWELVNRATGAAVHEWTAQGEGHEETLPGLRPGRYVARPVNPYVASCEIAVEARPRRRRWWWR